MIEKVLALLIVCLSLRQVSPGIRPEKNNTPSYDGIKENLEELLSPSPLFPAPSNFFLSICKILYLL